MQLCRHVAGAVVALVALAPGHGVWGQTASSHGGGFRTSLARPVPEAAVRAEYGTGLAQATRAVEGSGTAFVVHPEGLLLTAYHVVEDATSVAVSCNGQPAVAAQVTSSSPATDLALLTAVGPLGTESFLRLAPQPVIELGDSVFTIGYPAPGFLGLDPKYNNGTVTALSGLRGDATFLQVSVPIQPGNSGGPLVNEVGEVVGVVVATASAPAFIEATDAIPQNINWAVKSQFASALFDAPPQSARPARRVTSETGRRSLVDRLAAVFARRPPEVGPATTPDNVIERVMAATCFVGVRKPVQ